jgi:hypothetical protein
LTKVLPWNAIKSLLLKESLYYYKLPKVITKYGLNTTSFNYPKNSLHFLSEKRGLTVGWAEVQSASDRNAPDKGWLDAPPSVII